MSRYERTYGTDWDELDRDEAIERAYALGVATALGEHNREELEAIRGEVETSYDTSVVDLAFDEGRNEARELDPDAASGEDRPVWAALVEGEPVTVDEEDVPTGGQTGLPEAVDRIATLDRPDLDSTQPVDLPDFLEE